MKTLDQERAEFAWAKVEERRGDREYRNLVKSTPALVMSNGLMQTLAFLKGKGKAHHTALWLHISKWLHGQNIINSESDFETLMTSLSQMDSLEYQRATEESLNILKWLRYLADTVA